MKIVGKGDVDSLVRHMLRMRSVNMVMYRNSMSMIRRLSEGENGGVDGYRRNTTVRALQYPGYTDDDFKEVLSRLGERNLSLL